MSNDKASLAVRAARIGELGFAPIRGPKISNVDFRRVIAEEFSFMIGKMTGTRPCGDDAPPAQYYDDMPPEMKPWVDLCVERIAARLMQGKPLNAD